MGPRIYLRGAMTFVLNIGGAIPHHSFASFAYWSIYLRFVVLLRFKSCPMLLVCLLLRFFIYLGMIVHILSSFLEKCASQFCFGVSCCSGHVGVQLGAAVTSWPRA
jgi:hypothetical protein